MVMSRGTCAIRRKWEWYTEVECIGLHLGIEEYIYDVEMYTTIIKRRFYNFQRFLHTCIILHYSELE